MGKISSLSLCIIVYAFGIHSFHLSVLLHLQKAIPFILSSKEIYSVFPSKFGFCPVLPPIIYILKLSMM